MRINMHFAASKEGHKPPPWFDHLLQSAICAYAKEWRVSERTVLEWIGQNRNGWDRNIEEVFNSIGIKAASYTHPELPSRGVILDDSDPKIVEFKMKHG